MIWVGKKYNVFCSSVFFKFSLVSHIVRSLWMIDVILKYVSLTCKQWIFSFEYFIIIIRPVTIISENSLINCSTHHFLWNTIRRSVEVFKRKNFDHSPLYPTDRDRYRYCERKLLNIKGYQWIENGILGLTPQTYLDSHAEYTAWVCRKQHFPQTSCQE